MHAHKALDLSNNGNLTITNGNVTINSNQNDAASLTNNASITATSVGIVGSAQQSNNSSINPTPVTGITPLADPLAAIPVPSVSGPNHGAVNVTQGSTTISPGIYTDLSATNNGNMNNTADYQLTAPTSGVYQGLSIFYDRNNAAPLTLENNAGDNLTGTTHAASSALSFSNNGGTGQLDSLIVVATASLSNNGSINLAFDKTKNYQLVSSSALVE